MIKWSSRVTFIAFFLNVPLPIKALQEKINFCEPLVLFPKDTHGPETFFCRITQSRVASQKSCLRSCVVLYNTVIRRVIHTYAILTSDTLIAPLTSYSILAQYHSMRVFIDYENV